MNEEKLKRIIKTGYIRIKHNLDYRYMILSTTRTGYCIYESESNDVITISKSDILNRYESCTRKQFLGIYLL